MPHGPLISKIRCLTPNLNKSKVCNRNYLIYIATREGVDLSPLEHDMELLKDGSVNAEAANELYLKYISERPNSNGLFGNIDCSDVKGLANKIADMTAEGKNIYRGITSLTEADALALGFDQKERWVEALNISMPVVAREFNIPINKLNWTAAVHMEKGHPHCHYMFWQTDDQVQSSYIHYSKQNKCRSLLSEEFFKEERDQAIHDKDIALESTKKNTKAILDKEFNYLENISKMPGKIRTKDLHETAGKIIELIHKLPESGSLDYKLLKPQYKSYVDAFVKDFVNNVPALKREYNNYMASWQTISKSYSPTTAKDLFTMAEKEKKIKTDLGNIVLKVCRQILKNSEILSQYPLTKENNVSQQEEILLNEEQKTNPTPPEDIISNEEADYYDQMAIEADYYNQLPEEAAFCNFNSASDFSTFVDDIEVVDSMQNNEFNMIWSKEYKDALNKLYNDESPDFVSALKLMQAEANRNNVLAINDLAKMYENGLGTETNVDIANQYYAKALTGFHSLLKTEDNTTYINYRLGKFYEQGKGTDIDYEKAIRFYSKAVTQNHKYAQYSLGNMYLRGKGDEITADNKRFYHDKSLDLFRKSAEQGNAYAAYSFSFLAESEYSDKVEDSVITDFYTQALLGFEKMYDDRQADDLAYRLGSMHHNGKGTDISYEKAIPYYEKSIEYKNYNAHYALGKIYADNTSNYYDLDKAMNHLTLAAEQDHVYAQLFLGKIYVNKEVPCYDINQSIKYYTKAADQNNDFAQYQLGKLYLNHEDIPQDLEKAITYFTLSADQGNQHAQFALGKWFADKESEHYDINKALSWFEKSADQSNSFALFQLGKIYLENEDIPHDIEKAIDYLTLSANQENQYAQYTLGKWFADMESEHYDMGKAISLFEKSADQNNDFAQYQLGKIYMNHEDVPPDFEKAIHYSTLSAEQGNQHAQYTLGKWFADQESEHYDISKAILWFEKSADQNNDFAQYQLGKIYLDHEDVHPDFEKAITYFTLSANQSNQHAQYALGKCFADKESEHYDISKAISWFEKSADQNNNFAQFQLGKIYIENEDVPRDIAKGIHYLTLSANQENQYAQYALGKWFADQESEHYDIDNAINWLERASEQDNSFAQLKLGSIYLWGSHPKIKVNEKLAMQYLNQPIKNGNEYAANVIKMYENYKTNFMISTSYKLISNIFSAIVADNHLQKQNAEIAAHSRMSKKVMQAEAKRDHGGHSQD